jgi:Putative zinc-finger domain
MQRFTPYESPLKQFRAYRFHPEFKEDVAGGLRSMTFSHKIDPNAEFCRYELAGGICNDATCDFQHFRDIKLPGAWVI